MGIAWAVAKGVGRFYIAWKVYSGIGNDGLWVYGKIRDWVKKPEETEDADDDDVFQVAAVHGFPQFGSSVFRSLARDRNSWVLTLLSLHRRLSAMFLTSRCCL